MPKILCIETGTAVCSVALVQNSNAPLLRESDGPISHASKLSVYIDEILREANMHVSDLDAIAVSEGPGSYTGMRIGTSTAKGLCFGADKPLIAIGSLQALAMLALHKCSEQITPQTILCPMIDARRMEVYTAMFDSNAVPISETKAQIVDQNTYTEILEKNTVIFFGDGAEKFKQTIISPNAIFVDIKASALGMTKLAEEKFAKSEFVDTAYFEPFYLKDFVITKSKKDFFKKA